MSMDLTCGSASLLMVGHERFLRKYEASRNASWWEVCKGSSTYTTSLSLSVGPTDQTYSITEPVTDRGWSDTEYADSQSYG